MVQWEQDFQETLDLEEWHSISETASRSLTITSIIEANYKVLLRWYMVLATFVPGATGALGNAARWEQHITYGGHVPRSEDFGSGSKTLYIHSPRLTWQSLRNKHSWVAGYLKPRKPKEGCSHLYNNIS